MDIDGLAHARSALRYLLSYAREAGARWWWEAVVGPLKGEAPGRGLLSVRAIVTFVAIFSGTLTNSLSLWSLFIVWVLPGLTGLTGRHRRPSLGGGKRAIGLTRTPTVVLSPEEEARRRSQAEWTEGRAQGTEQTRLAAERQAHAKAQEYAAWLWAGTHHNASVWSSEEDQDGWRRFYSDTATPEFRVALDLLRVEWEDKARGNPELEAVLAHDRAIWDRQERTRGVVQPETDAATPPSSTSIGVGSTATTPVADLRARAKVFEGEVYLVDALRRFVYSHMNARYGPGWRPDLIASLRKEAGSAAVGQDLDLDLDLSQLVSVMEREWDTTFGHLLPRWSRMDIDHLRSVRNITAHHKVLTPRTAVVALDRMERLLRDIGAQEADEIVRVRADVSPS